MTVDERAPGRTRLTRTERNAFAGSVGGWAMDGFDMAIFSLVLAPVMAALLPASGYRADEATVGYFGQLSAAVFLLGWGFSFVWGPIADKFGRRPAMIGSILTFAVFTAAAGLATNVWMWMAFRFLAAVGVGGEWAMAGTLVAESVPERVRERLGGWLHSATYVGTLLTALVYLFFGEALGWRGMFFFGLVPAVLVFLIRMGTHEPATFARERRPGSLLDPVKEILRPPYRRRTWVNLTLLVVCVIGLWAGSTYVPTAMTHLATATGRPEADVVRLAGLSSAVAQVFTILGCVAVPAMAKRLGRRSTLAVLYTLMIIGIGGTYGVAYPAQNITLFFCLLPVLGFGGANFAVFTIWLPEQYPTRVRATAFAFATTLSRWVAAVGTFGIAFGIQAAGSLTVPLCMTALPFVAGILIVKLAPETRGRPLPA
ncbi:MAG TPA: MFS transporter [Streptosporangiaceae bacterium]|jgi:MFS family permease